MAKKIALCRGGGTVQPVRVDEVTVDLWPAGTLDDVEPFIELSSGIDDEEGIPMKAEDLGPGSCFGEEGLLMKSPSPVTVRFTTDGRLLTLPRDDFQRLLARPTEPG